MKGKKPRKMFKRDRRGRSDPLRAHLVELPNGKYGVAILGDPTGFRYERNGTGKMVGPYPGEEYRYPLHDGGDLTIRPDQGHWVCTHPALGVIGSAPNREIILLMAEAYAEALSSP